MRRLAARAGAYAPGIQEHLFYQVSRQPLGVSLDSVDGWMRASGGTTLSQLGYYVMARRTAAVTAELTEWIHDGKGYRAAVLGVDGRRLYNGGTKSEGDAVGLALYDATSGIEDRPEDVSDAAVVMIDPFPGVPRFLAPPRTLDLAHGSQKYATLLLYWTGYG